MNNKLTKELKERKEKIYNNKGTYEDHKRLFIIENELEKVDPVLMAEMGY